MDATLDRIRFPLLVKELSELANRRRTYIVRTVYAAALFGFGLLVLSRGGGFSTGEGARLGQGRAMFSALLQLQVAGICLFLPAMTAGALTSEKERDTLTLLLLTPIKPWVILLEKLLSRVIPMLCLVLLSFPLLAVAYSYGGVPTEALFAAMKQLILLTVQVAAFSLLCSAWCRTTVEAFLASYVLLGLSMTCLPFGPRLNFVTGGPGLWTQHPAPEIPAIVSTVIALVMARSVLHKRAFVPPRNVLLEMFQALDRMYQAWNDQAGGVVLVKDGPPFPEDDPVAWRERSKRSLGTFRYLFRVLVVLELPILIAASSLQISAVRYDAATQQMTYALWAVATALLCIHAASVISSEKSRQTWDTLLTTPLPGREIMLQKLAGVRRLQVVLGVPFISLFVFHHWLRDHGWNVRYLLLSLGTYLTFTSWTVWMSFWLGLKLPSQMKAVLASLVSASLIAGLPNLIWAALEAFQVAIPPWLEALLWSTPVNMVRALETGPRRLGAEITLSLSLLWFCFLMTIVAVGVATWRLRRHCLRHADALLGRGDAAGNRTATTSIEEGELAPL